jgi:LacI family transcriptional regulator
MNNPFFPEIAQAVERAAAAVGYAVLLVDAHGSAAEAEVRIASLKRHGVDGVIATEFFPGLGRLALPAVVIGRTATRMDSVSADDAAGGALLAEHLLQRGHRSFALVSGKPIGTVVARRDAFLARIEGKGEIVWESVAPGDGKITPEIVKRLARTDMSAVVCSCDADAITVLRALRAHRRDVPGTVSVVGFDDIPLASVVSPALTTVRQPYAALGAEAVGLVMARIANPKRRFRSLKLDVSLVVRDSVAVLPAAAPHAGGVEGRAIAAGVEA